MENINIQAEKSILENIDIQDIEILLKRIQDFHNIVKRKLIIDKDYMIILIKNEKKGTWEKKATLLKPGSEKILMLLGVETEFNIIKNTEDYNKGFFSFIVKCIVVKNGKKITEGIGQCNTKEKKYVDKCSYSVANTCLKMARKRAQIDATLTLASLSEVFTQDLEDIDINVEESKQSNNITSDTISDAQAKRMFALANGNTKLIKDVLKKFGFEKSTDVTKKEYNNICAQIQQN